MTSCTWKFRSLVGLVSLVGAFAGCGGGGGSGGTAGGSGFILADARYGRVVDEGAGPRLVSPLTTASVDPVTGLLIPGSLEPLASSVDVNVPQTLGLGAGYLPRVVPRNCVIELIFTGPIDAASVTADVADANGNVTQAGSIQLRTQDNKVIPIGVTMKDSRTIWIDPTTNGGVGFPPSPVDFGPSGEPRADATGFLKLRLPRTGTAIVRSTSGNFLGQRADKLGEPGVPIGINPGNAVLDFITQSQLIPTNETFNGFLPDLSPPRIARTHSYEKTLDFGSGDGATTSTITDVAAAFSAAAKAGAGEWAQTLLILRPGAVDEETHIVASNTRNDVTSTTLFAVVPQDGDVYRLERSEFYEPSASDPIDPNTFDPDNPENFDNTVLANFIESVEIDLQGNPVAAPLPMSGAVPSFSELRMRFNEPMAAESFRQWETFRVAFNPDGGPTSELLTDIVVDLSQTLVTIRPARIDATAGTMEIVGWGKGAKSLQLFLTTVPKSSYLQQNLTSDQVASFIDRGVRSISDVGGQPLAFPDSLFDPVLFAPPLPTDPAPSIRFSSPFSSLESASTQIPPPVVSSWGVMVHRMQGRPITGIDPATGNPGVGYRDQVNYYRPIGDVNLQVNGYLAGSPVVYSTKIHDDYFPPPHGQFGKFPLGVPAPLMSAGAPGGPQPHDGARFQTVWRDIDASPSRDALAGTLLDLYRVSWAPIGGNVTTDNYDNISIHCAHSPLRPRTTQNSAAASYPQSGIAQPFDYDTYISLVDDTISDLCPKGCTNSQAPNYWDSLITCVQPGTSYKVTQSNLFAPPFDGNAYCPWPLFDTNFQYNNGDIPLEELDKRDQVNADFNCSGDTTPWDDDRKFSNNPDEDNLGGDSLLFEVRIRPQGTTISQQNGFSIAIAVLLDFQPLFRVYTLGTPGKTVNPDNINGQQAARCALGATAGSNLRIGDNSRYFTVLDYVKTTSKITSPYVRVVPVSTSNPDYFTPILQPALADQPAGTSVTLEFEGATTVAGSLGTGFSIDVNVADTKPNVAFRATLVGNTTTLLLPGFDTIAIPYLRPSGS